MPGARRWPFERAKRLRILWRDGKTSREIAAILRITRCAVLGKLHRLGLLGGCSRAEKNWRLSLARRAYIIRTHSTSSMRVRA